MKSIIPFATAAALTLLASNPLLATTYTWTGPSSGGTWDTTATNFSAASGTPWDSTNGPSNIADFNTASLTATVSSVTTNGITFTNTATLSGSNITLAGTTPTITANANGSISSVLLGSAGLTKSGNSTLTLTAQNTFTGAAVVNAGTLELGFAGAFNSGGTIDSTSSITINSGATVIGIANDSLGSGFLHDPSYLKGGVTINEGGTLSVASGKFSTLDRNITSVGGTIASQGSGSYNFRNLTGAIYTFTSAAVSGTASTISSAGAGLGGAATFNVTKGGGAIDLNVTGILQNYLSSTGALTKTGNGVMVLSNANTYTGGTTVNGGTLLVNGGVAGTSSGTGTGAVTVSNSNTTLGGTGVIAPTGSNKVTINTGSLINPGITGAAGTLKINLSSTTGALTLASGSSLTFDIGAGSTGDKLSLLNYASGRLATNSNTINITSLGSPVTGSYTLINFYSDAAGTTATASGISSGFSLGTLPSGWAASLAYNTNSIDLVVTAVPESSTWIGASLMVGLSAFHLRRRFQGNRVVC